MILAHRLLSFVRARPVGFFAACMLVGAGVWALPYLSEPNGNIAVAPSLVTLISLGLAAGMLAPERPWRWAIAIAIGAPLGGLVQTIAGRTAGLFDSVAMLFVTLPLSLFIATPIAAGAYVGRFLIGHHRAPTDQSGTSISLTVSRFLFSAALYGLALILLPSPLVDIALVAVTALCAALYTAWFQVPPWRSAAVCVAGALTGFVMLLVYDFARAGPNHHMLPFEVWFVIIVTAPVGIIASWLAYAMWGGRHSREA